MIKSGVVAKSQHIFGRGMYFGDDFLLTTYFRPYVVRTLTYMDCFQLENTVISKLFQFGQFPRLQVRACSVGDVRGRHRGLLRVRLTLWPLRMSSESAETCHSLEAATHPPMPCRPVRKSSHVRRCLHACEPSSVCSSCALHALLLFVRLPVHCSVRRAPT
jgi:hypothetical protein